MKTGRITTNFRWSEAADRRANTMPGDVEPNVATMAGFLERVRAEATCPLRISSWYRSPDHPVERRKARPGAHSTGLAVDVLCHGEQAGRILRAALNSGVKGVGISQRGPRASRYIHLDIAPGDDYRPRPHIWSY